MVDKQIIEQVFSEQYEELALLQELYFVHEKKKRKWNWIAILRYKKGKDSQT